MYVCICDKVLECYDDDYDRVAVAWLLLVHWYNYKLAWPKEVSTLHTVTSWKVQPWTMMLTNLSLPTHLSSAVMQILA